MFSAACFVEKEFPLRSFLGLTVWGRDVLRIFQPSLISGGTESSVLNRAGKVFLKYPRI